MFKRDDGKNLDVAGGMGIGAGGGHFGVMLRGNISCQAINYFNYHFL